MKLPRLCLVEALVASTNTETWPAQMHWAFKGHLESSVTSTKRKLRSVCFRDAAWLIVSLNGWPSVAIGPLMPAALVFIIVVGIGGTVALAVLRMSNGDILVIIIALDSIAKIENSTTDRKDCRNRMVLLVVVASF